MEPYFQLNGNTATASKHCAGPWDPNLLHGGAPTALITHILETMPSDVPMHLTRLTVDLKRPVPVGDLEITTEITRQGRNIQTIDISLSANGKEVVKTSALKIRAVENQEPEEAALVPKAPARTDEAYPFPIRAGFAQAIDLRKAESCPPGMRDAVWFRINRPFFDNGVSSALVRAAATGDFSNAFGAGIDFEVWTYINADLTLHFTREPVGEWIMLAANGWMGPDGRGLAFGELADEQGYFGRSVQSLVLAKR